MSKKHKGTPKRRRMTATNPAQVEGTQRGTGVPFPEANPTQRRRRLGRAATGAAREVERTRAVTDQAITEAATRKVEETTGLKENEK